MDQEIVQDSDRPYLVRDLVNDGNTGLPRRDADGVHARRAPAQKHELAAVQKDQKTGMDGGRRSDRSKLPHACCPAPSGQFSVTDVPCSRTDDSSSNTSEQVRDAAVFTRHIPDLDDVGSQVRRRRTETHKSIKFRARTDGSCQLVDRRRNIGADVNRGELGGGRRKDVMDDTADFVQAARRGKAATGARERCGGRGEQADRRSNSAGIPTPASGRTGQRERRGSAEESSLPRTGRCRRERSRLPAVVRGAAGGGVRKSNLGDSHTTLHAKEGKCLRRRVVHAPVAALERTEARTEHRGRAVRSALSDATAYEIL